MITNLEESYALFIYECNLIEWAGRFTFPTIGFNSPSSATFINHPFTGQSNANEVACRDSNLLYQIGVSQSVVVEQRRMCVEWYLSDIERYGQSIAFFDDVISSCPCSLSQAFVDRRFFVSFLVSQARFQTVCFLLRFSGGNDRECCYTLESSMFGSLITDPMDGGSLLLFDERTIESYEENNFNPKSYCCSDFVGLCNLYSERRPSNDCARYRPPRISE